MNPPHPNHRSRDIESWLEAYSAGDSVGKSEIYAAVSASLAPILHGYRYLKSKGTFHFADHTADHYVTLERAKGILSLRFGVTHHHVERTRRSLFGPMAIQLRNKPLTISMYTANMGPYSQGWHLPYRVQWPILGHDGLAIAIPEIGAFVEESVLPYLERHRNPESIRDTYMFTPRRADYYFLSEQIIFAVDHILNRSDWLVSDRDFLLARQGRPEDCSRIDAAHKTVVAAQNGPESAA